MYVLISLAVLAVSTMLFRSVAGSLAPTKINMISWIFYFELIVQSFIGSVLAINGWDDHYILGRVQPQGRLYGWLAVQYTMIAMPMGMLIVLYFNGLRANRRLFQRYTSQPMCSAVSPRDSYIRLPLYALSSISVLAVVYTFYSIGNIPLLSALAGGDALSLAITRNEASLGFTGNIYVRNLFGILLTPVLAFVSYGYFRQTKSVTDRIWFYTMLVMSFFMLTYDLSKAPVVVFALGFLFFRVLYGDEINKSMLLIFGGLALLIVLLSYWLIMRETDLAALFSYNSGIGGRILLSQIAGTFFAFEHFPASHEFIGFTSLSSYVSDALGYPDSDRAAIVMAKIFNPAGGEEGALAVMNSLFIAEAWANFGLIGVLVAPFYVGVFIQALFLFFLKSKKTPVLLGVYAYLSLRLPVTGGFNDFIYPPGLATIAFIIVTLYLVAITVKVAVRNIRTGRVALQDATDLA
jgi:hypothetical protein